MTGTEALAFDMYGTLVDPMRIWNAKPLTTRWPLPDATWIGSRRTLS